MVEDHIKELVDWNNFKQHSGTGFDHYAIARFLVQVLDSGIPGAVVELGCHVGETSKVLGYIMEKYESPKSLYVYDSFQGLPEPEREKGDGYGVGTMKASKEALIENFKTNNLTVPIIVEGWFKDAIRVPDQICFAFFDGDFYSSIKESFEMVWDRMPDGGIIAIHDYFAKALGGVKLATDNFISNRNHHVLFGHKDQELGNDILIIQKG